jgi:hypothetical protein
MESTKSRVAEIGMNHYLSKPIKKKLYDIVKELANKTQSYVNMFDPFFFSDLFRQFLGYRSDFYRS